MGLIMVKRLLKLIFWIKTSTCIFCNHKASWRLLFVGWFFFFFLFHLYPKEIWRKQKESRHVWWKNCGYQYKSLRTQYTSSSQKRRSGAHKLWCAWAGMFYHQQWRSVNVFIIPESSNTIQVLYSLVFPTVTSAFY